MSRNAPVGIPVLGVRIDTGSEESIRDRILEAAAERKRGYVCHANVHSIVTASRDHRLAEALRGAFLCLPDGAPVAWAVRRSGIEQRRIAGPDLMLSLIGASAAAGIRLFFYGTTDATLSALVANLHSMYPEIEVAGTYSPPFRPLTSEETTEVVELIKASDANITFVGLGCPKQEVWMAEVSEYIPSIMIGVGAALDFHAGVTSRAPRTLRNLGLEWLHRLAQEPRRLWRRYLTTNTVFLARMLAESLSRGKDA